jgi:hypothetical protein
MMLSWGHQRLADPVAPSLESLDIPYSNYFRGKRKKKTKEDDDVRLPRTPETGHEQNNYLACKISLTMHSSRISYTMPVFSWTSSADKVVLEADPALLFV